MHENDQLSYVSAMRLREDEVFLRRITQDLPKGLKSNIQMVDLNLKDAPIRLRIAEEECCTTPVNPADPSLEKIRKALTRQAEAGLMQALVLPGALGNHVDHLTVREAALPLTPSVPTAFYEDLPYAAIHASAAGDLDALKAAAATLNEPLSPVLCGQGQGQGQGPGSESAVERKQKLILGYASQIDSAAGTLISDFATRYNGGERLWANRAWTEIADSERLSSSG